MKRKNGEKLVTRLEISTGALMDAIINHNEVKG
jgi:hypothetical protein